MYNENCDCIFITESWLHSGICDGVIDPRDEYYIMRKDRYSHKGGGVCVLVKRCFSVIQVVIADKYASLEVMGIDFIGIKPKLQIFAVYRPPYYDVDAVLYMQTLIDCLSECMSDKCCNVVLGDFILPRLNWNLLSGPRDSLHIPFIDFVSKYGLAQLINFPTRGESILDVLLTNIEQIVAGINCLPPIGCSDHAILEFSLILPKLTVTHNDYVAGYKYMWHRADYDSLIAYLSSVDWNSVICCNPSAAHSWSTFISMLRNAIELFVPKKIHQDRPCTGKPCNSRNVRKCAATKRRLWRRLTKWPCDTSLRSKYRDCVHQWKQLLIDSHARTEELPISADNLGAFYRYVNKRITNNSTIGVIVDSNGTHLTDNQLKANAFNRYFASVGIRDNNVIPSCGDVPLCSTLDSMFIDPASIVSSINKLKGNCSCGPDGLPPILFKRLKHVISYPLALLYNQILSVGYVPSEWLTAHIVPVFKKGIASQVSNYRPISLTCVLSKILERLVVGRIVDHLHYNNILHSAQHGFLKSRSTCTNLLQSLNDWSIIVQSRQQVAIVYIDFSKAFDVVSHPKLFARLYSYGIRDSVLLWLKNFFTGRTHQTKIGSSFSDICDLISGVIQGSVSCFLFSLTNLYLY